jgi:hypothetical protein
MKNILIASSILLSSLLCGCVLKYENVSGEPEYSVLLNNRYALNTEMYILGINLPPGYGDDINLYVTYPVGLGKISGPEVLSEEILEAGTILEIQSIKSSINHLPKCQEIDAVVTVTPYKKAVDVPITIDLKYLQSTNYVNKL